ncbi:universal stress protein [Streptomyces sp. E11-3]|uniref:universal stress protein n=1 Tax=Streptomyces sp. E11-3 TaxID=3110112 RepID=UPI00397F7426
MMRPVAVGVDGSAESLAGVAWAAREALRRDLPLRLVHAWDWNPRPTSPMPASPAQRGLAQRILHDAGDSVRRAHPELRVTEDQIEAPAATALLETAERSELLVLGSRGLSGLTGFLVGSVALGVVAKAVRPVVLVRAGEQPSDEHLPADDGSPSLGTGYRDVVLGLDVGDPCDEVIEFAFEAARLRGARLRVVHAWHARSPLKAGPGEVGLVDDPRQREEWRGFVNAVLHLWRGKYAEVEVAETIVRGRATTALLRAASGASLLVVGRRMAERPVGPHTGPVTHAVIHHVDCPVAVVPHS